MNENDKIKNIDDHIIIVDGYGFVFRAYHVSPPLSAPDGTAVGALYGFTSMMLKLLNDFKPTKIVMVFDSGQKNFRHQIYDQYKANRPPAPDDLVVQLKLLRDAAKALNIEVLEQEGYEADDIIATLARISAEKGHGAIIVSSDKDLMQLTNEHIRMYDAGKSSFVTDDTILKKFGVTAEKVRDVQALIGDKSDNIPGAHGVGPKTASKLIEQFGDLNGIYDNLDQIKSENTRQKLIDDKENVYLSWQLVGLDDKVKLDFCENNYRWVKPSAEQIGEYLNKYGFKSLFKRAGSLLGVTIIHDASVPEQVAHGSAGPERHPEIFVLEGDKNIQALRLIIDKTGYCAISLDQQDGILQIASENSIFTINITNNLQKIGDNLSLFAPVDVSNSHLLCIDDIPEVKIREFVQDLLQDKSVIKICFDLKRIIKFCKFRQSSSHDLSLMAYLFSAGFKTKTENELLEVYSSRTSEDIAPVFYYHEAFSNLKAELIKGDLYKLYVNLDLPICSIIALMEENGIKIDVGYLRKLSEEFNERLILLEKEIYKIAGGEFNVNSPKQLAEILFEKMNLPYGKKSSKSGTFSTNVDVLEKLSLEGHEIAQLLLEYRHLSKLKSTYTDTLPKVADIKTSRVHTTFYQNVTATSRFSSKDPNVQNIPIRSQEGGNIRAAFVADDGNLLISADYSQIELRILSHIADIKQLQESFINGEDIHARTASQIFKIDIDQVDSELRRRAKAINFGIIYGISAFGLARQLGCPQRQASDYIKQYFDEYPLIAKYMDETVKYAKLHGYVENLFGRRSYIPAINSSNKMQASYAARAAINAPLQSLNADIVKTAMINCMSLLEKENYKTKLLLQIHDELIFEAPKDEVQKVMPLIKTTMEQAISLKVPTKVDINAGLNWQLIH